MNKELDLEIYKHISNEMDVAEVYLGHIPFAFHYTKAEFTATCTEAFPFDPFDKVICELLKVEEPLSFENIGDILGLNVYASENPKRYLDLAEKEILTEALQSLASPDFGMIVGGDINFSTCRLTRIGREYAQKKCKYRVTANKPFTIYFDHTTGNHIKAKQLFEFVAGKLSGKQFAIDLADESTLKGIAAVQVPEIYNPNEQYSFTDPLLKQQRNLFIEFPVAVTFNTKGNSYRFYCYDMGNKNLHKEFSEWINVNETAKQNLLEEFSRIQTRETDTLRELSSVYSNQVTEFDASTKIAAVKSMLLKQEFIDEQLFFTSFDQLFNATEQTEFYLCLQNVTESISNALKLIIQKSEKNDSRVYIIFPIHNIEKASSGINQLKILASECANLYVTQQEVKSFLLICKTEAKQYYFELISGAINNFTKKFLQRKVWDQRAEKIETYFLEKFSDEYAIKICGEANEVINNDLNETVSKDQLDELEYYKFKLEPFANIVKHGETVKLTLELIEHFKEDRIERLEKMLNVQFDKIESGLANVTDEKEFLEIQNVFAKTTAEIIFGDSEAFRRSERLNPLFNKKREEFAEEKKTYCFIIDTNIFIEDTGIIQKIHSKDRIVIAAKVLDELDKHKGNPTHKEAASKVIREIFADKNKNIFRAKANIRLLPPDFNKKLPDNLILATALVYKDKNGILISDDKALHEKAKLVEMQVMTYTEFISTFVNHKK